MAIRPYRSYQHQLFTFALCPLPLHFAYMLLTDELLLHYRRCSRRAFLDIYGEEGQKSPEKDFLFKLKAEKEFHHQQIISHYGLNPHQPRNMLKTQEEEVDKEKLIVLTKQLMSQGVESIYKGVVAWNLIDGEAGKITLTATPTVLIKQNIPSELGNWSYYPLNIHLGKNVKPEYKLLMAFTIDILNQIQGINLTRGEMALRDNRKPHKINLKVWFSRTQELINECFQMLVGENIPDVYISRQKCSFCPWYEGCYQKAKSDQHLSLIPGMTPKRIEYLKQIGVNNMTTLSQTSIADLTFVFTKGIADRLLQQSISLISHQAIFKQPNLLPIPNSDIELYFDIEADGNLQGSTQGNNLSNSMWCDRTLDYLLGILLIDKKNNQQKYYSFLAKTPEEEKIIWHQFLEFINQYPNAPIFHYSEYEVETIKRLAHLYQTSSIQLKTLLSRLFDLHKILINSFYLPVENYSLKTVANWLGFRWRDPKIGKLSSNGGNVGGDQCVFWYDQWLKTGDSTWLEYIVIYNEDDCQGTYELKKWMEKYNNFEEKKLQQNINNCEVLSNSNSKYPI
ncbi:TM0106 family RecB-like putative nuclease [Cyanobacterium aponinum]|nr:TM0106 family RecB-like putative nuclease [Cyanobacterium aponinum]